MTIAADLWCLTADTGQSMHNGELHTGPSSEKTGVPGITE